MDLEQATTDTTEKEKTTPQSRSAADIRLFALESRVSRLEALMDAQAYPSERPQLPHP